MHNPNETSFVKMRLGEGDASREYALLPMPPGKAVYFIPKVTKALSSVMLGDVKLDDLNTGNLDINTAAKIILGGLAKCDPEALTKLGLEAIQYEVYAGHGKLSDSNHFDNWFQKHPGDMLQVLGWAVWHNCKDFFPGGSAALEGFKTMASEGLESRSLQGGSQNTTLGE